MLIAQGLIFTHLHTCLDLPLTASPIGIQRFLRTLDPSFFSFPPPWRSFRRSCLSQTFWFWFSCFRQSLIWNNMQMPCNVSFMYDHAWMKCPCIKFIFHLFFSFIKFATFLVWVQFTAQLALFLSFFILEKHFCLNSFSSCHIPTFLSSKTNIITIWFSYYRKHRSFIISFFLRWILISTFEFNKFCIHSEQSLMQCN